MGPKQTIEVIRDLANGINPLSGEVFAEDEYVDDLLIASFNSNDGLFTYEGTHFFIKDPKKTDKLTENKLFFIKQGFFEASNELPGMGSQYIVLPYLEGTAKASKYLFQSYDHMFRAAGPE